MSAQRRPHFCKITMTGEITITEHELVTAQPTYIQIDPSVTPDGSLPPLRGEQPINVKLFDALQNLLHDKGMPLNPFTRQPLQSLNYVRINHNDAAGKITFKWWPKSKNRHHEAQKPTS